MPRIIIKTAQAPYKIKTVDGEVAICECGLSKNQPFCDGSHLKTLDEKKDELYQYDDKGQCLSVETDEGDDDCECCCGGKCEAKNS
ncbi:MAG TPA: hypothetical protein DEP87_01130 [Candidatus Pacebacteria bacterium]|nr:hypothetical protein [Candidatus Paceibacterota bacterium]